MKKCVQCYAPVSNKLIIVLWKRKGRFSRKNLVEQIPISQSAIPNFSAYFFRAIWILISQMFYLFSGESKFEYCNRQFKSSFRRTLQNLTRFVPYITHFRLNNLIFRTAICARWPELSKKALMKFEISEETQYKSNTFSFRFRWDALI